MSTVLFMTAPRHCGRLAPSSAHHLNDKARVRVEGIQEDVWWLLG